MRTRRALSPLYCILTDSRSSDDAFSVLNPKLKGNNRLVCTYATLCCVPSSNIPFVGDDWVDEEEQQRDQSRRFRRDCRHTMWRDTKSMFQNREESARRNARTAHGGLRRVRADPHVRCVLSRTQRPRFSAMRSGAWQRYFWIFTSSCPCSNPAGGRSDG